MKKIAIFLILFIFSYNFAFAEVVFYEDFTFYGELISDIDLNKTIKKQEIQVIFPSYFNKKIPFILNGQAELKKIDGKSMIYLDLYELSTNAKRYIPVEILVTGINGKKLKKGAYPNQNSYKTSFKTVNAYNKEFALFPINRFNAIPKVAKPSKNNFVMLLEPIYAIGGIILFALSPITAPFFIKDDFCDIPKGSIIEFEFSTQLTKQEVNKIISEEYL